MIEARASRWLFLASGVFALLCIPAHLLAEQYSLPRSHLFGMQSISVALCFASSLAFLWVSRGTWSGTRRVALAAAVMSGMWLAFVAYVLLTLDFSGMD